MNLPIQIACLAILAAVFSIRMHAQAQAQSGSMASPSAMSKETPLSLTLENAVALALKQNLDLQVSNVDAAYVQQEQKVSRAALLPHASLDASDTITKYNLEALIGLSIEGVPTNVGPYQAIHLGPTLHVPIFDLSLVRQYQASTHRTKAGASDDRSVREQTVLLTVSEYLAHLRAVASVKAAQSRVALAQDLAKQAHDLEESGVATQIDISRAEVRLRTEQQQLIDAQREVLTTTYALRRLLNVPDATGLTFTDADSFFQTPTLELNESLANALDRRPELSSLKERLQAAKYDHRASLSNSLPKLRFDGHWDEQGRSPQALYPGREYKFSFSVPIFEGGRLTAERRQTALAETRSERNLDLGRNRVTEQVRNAEAELNAAKQQVRLGHEQVGLATEEVTLSEGRFTAGVTDNIEVISAQDSLARANDSEIAALFRYNIARAQLARAVGLIEDTYTHP